MWRCTHCLGPLPFDGQLHVRAVLQRCGLPPALVNWLCCTFGIDAQYLQQMRLCWALGPVGRGALAGYPPADRHRLRPQDFPCDR